LTLKGRLSGVQKRGVDSKRRTPKQGRNVDESKSARRAVAAAAAEVYGRGKKGEERCWMRFMSSFAYSRKDAIKLMGAKAG
jgi:hypothetical protein